MSAVTVEQRRGFGVEGEHHVSAVVCDASGRVLERIGVELVTTFRSAAKPFQLATSVSLLSDSLRAGLSSKDLAIGTASHHGESPHLAQVESLLARFGTGVGQLFCGAHAPSNAASAVAMYARGERPTALHNNCSGKHAFMAGACAVQGYAEDYRPADHPLQQRALANLQGWCAGAVVGTVVDGCGLPCFVLPLSAMAHAWATLAVEMAHEPPAKAGLGAFDEQRCLGAIGHAMRQEPCMMSGTDAFDGWLNAHTEVASKVGAQGILCLALPSQKLGVALKPSSGSDVVRPAAALAVLGRLFPALLPASVPEHFTALYNVVGQRVGEYVAR